MPLSNIKCKEYYPKPLSLMQNTFPFFRHIIILFWLVFSINLKAQTASVKLEEKVPFEVYKTTETTLSPNDIIASKSIFKLSSSITEPTQPNDTFWIRLDFENSLNKINSDSEIYLKLNSFDYGEVYFNNEQSITKKTIGLFNTKRISKKIPLDNYYSQIKIDKKSLTNNRYLFLKVKRVTFHEQLKHWNFTISGNSYLESYRLNDFNTIIPYYILLGLCILAFFWAISFFLILKNPAFIYYALYILLYFIYLAGDYLGIYKFIFNNDYLSTYWFSQSFIFIGHIPYVLYLIYYLNTKKAYPLVHKPLKILIISNFVSLFLIYLLYLTNYIIGLVYILNYGFKIIYIIPVFALFRLIYIGKNHLANFAAVATLALCFSGLGRMYLASPEDGLFLDSQIYAIIGFYIEIIVFAFGLTYKVYLDFLEKLKFQQESNTNKNKALRAQINPHFIFNSLSSIQHLITSNNKAATLKYLSKFSRLTRNILESSIETNVILEDEIKMLKDYLELESLRFSNAFSYKINIDTNVDINAIEVPFMILQPFVENAIIHGLLPKNEGEKVLELNFKHENNFIICEIDDNGVGRKVSVQKVHIHQEEKKSRGLEVTKKRLQILNQSKNNIEIIDKTDVYGNSLGTKIVIKIQE